MSSDSPGTNGSAPKRQRRAAASALAQRMDFATEAGLSYLSSTGQYKRDLYAALGYDRGLTPQQYRHRYERGGVAAVVVEAYPEATWPGCELYETEDPGTKTKFEAACTELFKRFSFWSKITRLDVLAGIGRYGVLVIGVDEQEGDLSRPATGGDLAYLTPLSEDRCPIQQLDEDPRSGRFGLPLYYSAQLIKSKSTRVHWSRVVHVAEGLLDDEVYGTPRLRSVWNYLDDLDKIVGGGAEASWKRAHFGLHLDIDSSTPVGEAEERKMADQLDDFEHNMRRNIRTFNTRITPLTAPVHSFGPNAEAVLGLIGATKRIPKRILMGSERGELSSAQDEDNFYARVAERREKHAEPMLRLIVDRLIELGALPEPQSGEYHVAWAEEDELNEAEVAEVISTVAGANKTQFEAEGKLVMTSDEMRDRWLGMEPLPEPEVDEGAQDEVSSSRDNATSGAADEEAPPAAIAFAASRRGAAGRTFSEAELLHAAAERHEARVARAFRNAWDTARANVDMPAVRAALAAGDRHAAELAVAAAMKDFAELVDEGFTTAIADELLNEVGELAL